MHRAILQFKVVAVGFGCRTDAKDALLGVGGLAGDVMHGADVGHGAAEALIKEARRQIQRQCQQLQHPA